jgi:hypothetical protein
MFASMPNRSLYHSRFKRLTADSGLGAVTNMEMFHFMSPHMFTIRFIRHFKSCSFILSFWSHVNACITHVKHHLYFKRMLRTHPPNTKPFQGTQGLYSWIPTISSGFCVFRSNIWKKEKNIKFFLKKLKKRNIIGLILCWIGLACLCTWCTNHTLEIVHYVMHFHRPKSAR